MLRLKRQLAEARGETYHPEEDDLPEIRVSSDTYTVTSEGCDDVEQSQSEDGESKDSRNDPQDMSS